jgi:hypothetical protein
VSDVRVVFSKWGDRPHYELDAVRLGDDEHGSWLGIPVGTRISRPGVAFDTGQPQVALVPHDGAFVATFHGPGGPSHCWLYVDITTVPVWRGDEVHAVDLDLDVVKDWTGRVWVDDEDEFADHRVRFGYPDDVAGLAVAACDAVLGSVRAGAAPYDGEASARWLRRLDVVMMGR